MRYVHLSEGGFQVVHPLGLLPRTSGVVKVLFGYGWYTFYIDIYRIAHDYLTRRRLMPCDLCAMWAGGGGGASRVAKPRQIRALRNKTFSEGQIQPLSTKSRSFTVNTWDTAQTLSPSHAGTTSRMSAGLSTAIGRPCRQQRVTVRIAQWHSRNAGTVRLPQLLYSESRSSSQALRRSVRFTKECEALAGVLGEQGSMRSCGELAGMLGLPCSLWFSSKLPHACMLTMRGGGGGVWIK